MLTWQIVKNLLVNSRLFVLKNNLRAVGLIIFLRLLEWFYHNTNCNHTRINYLTINKTLVTWVLDILIYCVDTGHPQQTIRIDGNNIIHRVYSLVIFHFYIITRYQSLFAFELGTKPIDIVFHVDYLKTHWSNSATNKPTMGRPETQRVFTRTKLTLSRLPFLKLSSSGAVALKSCLAIASIVRPFKTYTEISPTDTPWALRINRLSAAARRSRK